MNTINNKKSAYRVIAWFVLFAILFSNIYTIAIAATAPVAAPPSNLEITEFTRNSMVFEWNAITFPDVAELPGYGFDVYRIDRDTNELDKLDKNVYITEGEGASLDLMNYLEFEPIGANSNEGDIISGQIYQIYSRSIYEFLNDDGYETIESVKSNAVNFIYDLDVRTELNYETNYIKISWDDVWDNDGRINYRILVSEDPILSETQGELAVINGDMIESSSVVTPVNGRLEYIYNATRPGASYYITVIPLPRNSGTDFEFMSVTAVKQQVLSTNLVLKSENIGKTESGTLWRLYWDSVKTNSDDNVNYKIFRVPKDDASSGGNANTESWFAELSENQEFYLHVEDSDPVEYVYQLLARLDDHSGEIMEFYSLGWIELSEEYPEYPEAPRIVDGFEDVGETELGFDPDNPISEDSAYVMWEVSKDGNGNQKLDLYYDMYLFEDIDDLNNLTDPLVRATLPKVASSIQMTDDANINDSNYVRNTSDDIVGFKYKINDLNPNTTYYFAIIAKKDYLVNIEGVPTVKSFESQHSVKVLVTDTDTSKNRPYAAPSPPFMIKEVDNKRQVFEDSAILNIRRLWNEVFDGVWRMMTEDEETNGTILNTREAELLNGYTLKVVGVDYFKAELSTQRVFGRDYLTYSDLKKTYLDALKVDMCEYNVSYNVDDPPYSFDLEVENLENNTTYLAWLIIVNEDGVESDPSDPIIFTTVPEYEVPLITPTVPTDVRALAGDTFVDLFWQFKTNEGYSYRVKYGKEENMNKAEGEIEVDATNLENQTFLRINDLEPGTQYFFWIKSVVSHSDSGETKESVWGDPIGVKTEPYFPPVTPLGFGIKNDEDAVSYEYITYEWTDMDNVDYILEFSNNMNFEDSEKITLAAGETEYKKAGLLANHNYYARLYSHDADTDLLSVPTSVVKVSTKRSNTEYDGHQELGIVPIGDIVDSSNVIKGGVWTTEIIGINSDRFIEMIGTDRYSEYIMDLTNSPGIANEIQVEISDTAIRELGSLKENVIIQTKDIQLKIVPNMISQQSRQKMENYFGDYNNKISIKSPVNTVTVSSVPGIKELPVEIKFLGGNDNSYIQLDDFQIPIQVGFVVDELLNYNRGELSVYQYNKIKKSWDKIKSTGNYGDNTINTEIYSDSILCVAKNNSIIHKDMYNNQYLSSLQNIQNIYDMPSIDKTYFRPNESGTLGEIIGMVMDLMDYPLSSSSVQTAKRAGLLEQNEPQIEDLKINRDLAVAMAVRLYRIKTGDKIYSSNSLSSYADAYKIKASLKDEISFAVENGIVFGRNSKYLEPDQRISRIEFIVILERILQMIGEL